MRQAIPLQILLTISHLAVFFLPLIVVFGTGALAFDLRRQTEEDLRHQGLLLALHLETLIGANHLTDAVPAIAALLPRAKGATLAGFRVVDTGGVVVASSSGEDIGEDLSDNVEVVSALAGRLSVEVRPRDNTGSRNQPISGPSRRASERVFLAVPVLQNDAVIGAIVLSRTPREEVQALYQMAPNLLVGAVIALFGTAGFAFYAGYRLSRSLRRLADASLQLANGTVVEIQPSSRVLEALQLGEAMAAMQERLRARLRYISEFAGNVSHEFKTPVSTLRGTLELLRDDPEMPPEQQVRFLDNGLAELDRLNKLVSGLLRLARAEEGGVRQPVALADVVAAVQGRFPTIVVQGEGGQVQANPDDIAAALGNLVENALRYGQPPVEVVLWSTVQQTGVEVIDHGPGISAANLPRVFDRFFTTHRREGGTGLGLALVRTIAEAHGGQISVTSVPGRTCFRLALPRTS